jgi:outer membrane usher protein
MICPKGLRSLLLISVMVFFVPSLLQAVETVPLRIILNTVDKGEHLVIMTPEGDILLTHEQLAEIGFKEITGKGIEKESGLISLRSLSPDVIFDLNMQESALNITAEPKLLEKNIIDMGYKRPEKVTYTKENSAFLNYAVSYSAGDKFDFQSLSIPTEMGIRISDYLLYSNFAYTKTENDNRFVRMMTSITRDDTVNIRRYTVGDFFASSGVLGGSGIMGGVSVTKNFSLNPYFIRYQGLYLSGILQTPSEVELFINNVSMKKEKLPPGEFDISNLYGRTGAGNATLVITDAFGKEQTIVTPFYLSSNLLIPGLHDYSYNIGFKRFDFGEKSFDYKEPAFLGYHRYGFTKTLTGGMRAEVDKDLINFEPMVTFIVGRAGEVDSAFAFSHGDGRYGYGAFLSYTYNSNMLSGNASFRYFSKEYINLSYKEASVKPRFEGRIGLGFHSRWLGSISSNVQFLSKYGEDDTKSIGVFYNRSLGSNMSLSISASRIEERTTNYNVFAGLVFILGKNHFGTLNFQSQDSQKAISASIEKNPPRGTGIGYKFQVETKDDEDWEPGGASYIQYNGPYGIYSAHIRRTSDEEDSYNLNLSGGMAFLGNSFYMSRPMTDSFAMVNVGDVEGVRVYYSNSEIAKTNGKGEALVPSLISYNDNKLSFDPTDLPVNYELKEIEKYVSPAYRSGSTVKFDVKKI